MNYQEPLRTSNIDFSKIVYPKTRANQNKKIVLVKYNEKGKLKNFVFQTPTLLNLSKPILSNGYGEIEVALVGKEKGKVNKFIKFLNYSFLINAFFLCVIEIFLMLSDKFYIIIYYF